MSLLSQRQPNRLLALLILISMGIHVMIFARISGLYQTRSTVYIELEMRERERPPVRSISRPPMRLEPPAPERITDPVPTRVSTPPRPVVPDLKDVPDEAPPTPTKAPAHPETPEIPFASAVSWAPRGIAIPSAPPRGVSTDSTGPAALTSEGSAGYPTIGATVSATAGPVVPGLKDMRAAAPAGLEGSVLRHETPRPPR